MAPYPRAGEMFVALVLLAEIALFAMVTVRFRFRLVDWRVESRDIQEALRELEAQQIMLRRDVAALSTGPRLAEFAEQRFELTPARPDQLARLEVPLDRARAWDQMLSRSRLGAGEVEGQSDPLSWKGMLDRLASGQRMFESLGWELEGARAGLGSELSAPAGAAASADTAGADAAGADAADAAAYPGAPRAELPLPDPESPRASRESPPTIALTSRGGRR
jgi:hypothetical protein